MKVVALLLRVVVLIILLGRKNGVKVGTGGTHPSGNMRKEMT